MDETYASNVDSLNELTREYRQSEINKAEVMKQSVLDKFNDKLTDYSDKWKAVEEGGKDELAGQFGLKGAYRGGKKVFELYKKYKNSKTARHPLFQVCFDVRESTHDSVHAGPIKGGEAGAVLIDLRIDLPGREWAYARGCMWAGERVEDE